MMETEDAVGKQTLVGRVSNMLKDGSYSGPPMLFRHASMQKIRHCCQNLNLFPYLLYSFDNSKSHPIACKVHLCFGQLLESITTRIFFLYKNFRQSLLRAIRHDEFQTQESAQTVESVELVELVEPVEPFESVESVEWKPAPKFPKFDRQKPKQTPLFLVLAVYFAPLLLAFQLIGLFGLTIFGKYTPGFIFLISALLFLGCIWLKIIFHESVTHIAKYEKNKVQ